ncbi:hypothetical protein Tco_1252664 [Tanacetum coccineum]
MNQSLSCADRLLHHEVEGRVDGLVKEVEELENQRAELVVGLVIKMVKEVTKVSGQMKALMKSRTSPRSSLSNCEDLLPTIIAQVGNHVATYIGDVLECLHLEMVELVVPYKDFVCCNPKVYDRKGGR